MIEMTRGCPMRCGFCYEANRLRQPRTYSFERVAEEISLRDELIDELEAQRDTVVREPQPDA